MLIEFSVTNFRSFGDKQTLSMVADSSTELQAENTFLLEGKSKLPRLLKSASIYGANAAGKSNVLFAMQAMRDIVLYSANAQLGESIKFIHPHALREDEPTEFEIIFIIEGVRYQYGFAATRQLIMEEWLFVSPSSRAQQWLSRVYATDPEKDEKYDWLINQTFIKGNKSVWKEATRDNALFLSTAAQLNSEQFGRVLEWFRHNLKKGMTEDGSLARNFALCENLESKKKVLQFLSAADLGINDIEIVEHPLSSEELFEEFPSKVKQDYAKNTQRRNFVIAKNNPQRSLATIEVNFMHQTSEGKDFKLPFTVESMGTRRLFENAGMWLDALEKGGVTYVDELESSLHPLIARFLVSLFNNPETNPKNAQLIFTTHDTTLLDNDLLRRDQIWFVEKDQNQMTHLYPLSDFKPRKNEALQKGYLQGRYSALPYISTPEWLE